MKTEDLVGQETILVAEDERVVRDLTARILEESGYRILRAKNSSETVAMFEAHKDEISLVLLDLIMPGEGGVKVFEKLVVANPNIRVLFCSGYAPERTATQFLLDKGLRLIAKPFTPHALLRSIRELLDKPPSIKRNDDDHRPL